MKLRKASVNKHTENAKAKKRKAKKCISYETYKEVQKLSTAKLRNAIFKKSRRNAKVESCKAKKCKSSSNLLVRVLLG